MENMAHQLFVVNTQLSVEYVFPCKRAVIHIAPFQGVMEKRKLISSVGQKGPP